MSFGKMNAFIDLGIFRKVKDADGFASSVYEGVASVRAYQEGRHGSSRWANLASFSEATDLFRWKCAIKEQITTPRHIDG